MLSLVNIMKDKYHTTQLINNLQLTCFAIHSMPPSGCPLISGAVYDFVLMGCVSIEAGREKLLRLDYTIRTKMINKDIKKDKTNLCIEVYGNVVVPIAPRLSPLSIVRRIPVILF